MRTVKEIAEKLGVDPVIAYGLLHFMVEKEFVSTGKAEKVMGKKGKPATTYSFDRVSVDRLYSCLLESLGAQAINSNSCSVPGVIAANEPVAVV